MNTELIKKASSFRRYIDDNDFLSEYFLETECKEWHEFREVVIRNESASSDCCSDLREAI